jgi:hypothetical protein
MYSQYMSRALYVPYDLYGVNTPTKQYSRKDLFKKDGNLLCPMKSIEK